MHFFEGKECVWGRQAESMCPSPGLCRGTSFETGIPGQLSCFGFVFSFTDVLWGFPLFGSGNSENTLMGHKDSF